MTAVFGILRFIVSTQLGRAGLLILAGLGAFWWFVDDVADKREAAAVEKTTKTIERQITKTNTKAKTNADEAAKRVRDCYRRGRAWSVRDGKCS